MEINDPPLMYADLRQTIDYWVNNYAQVTDDINFFYVDTIEWLYTGQQRNEEDMSKNVFSLFLSFVSNFMIYS